MSPGRGPFRLRYRVVDAFTNRPFSGNPAAVVLPSGEEAHGASEPRGGAVPSLDDRLMQAVAAEMNLSETAFPLDAAADGRRPLRWFTPTTEVTLCGHATLAAAHALVEDGASAPLEFSSLSGPLTVHAEGDGRLRLDFPSDPPRALPTPDGLMEALGLDPETPFLSGTRCAVVPIDDPDALDALDPSMAALGRARLPDGVMGVSVTAPAGEDDVDFRSRFFGPWVGVPEDPVTGMAHTVLGPYWAERLGRETLEARQGSRRRGALTVRLAGERVHLLGRAVTVARGEIVIPREG